MNCASHYGLAVRGPVSLTEEPKPGNRAQNCQVESVVGEVISIV